MADLNLQENQDKNDRLPQWPPVHIPDTYNLPVEPQRPRYRHCQSPGQLTESSHPKEKNSQYHPVPSEQFPRYVEAYRQLEGCSRWNLRFYWWYRCNRK
ncbi:hypothetical protein D3C72_556350 [compost metagenome]